MIATLHDTFSLKDLGKLHYFLGIELSYLSTGGLFLSPPTYISDLLQKTNMAAAKSITTPLVSGSLSSAHGGKDFILMWDCTRVWLEHYSMLP